MDKPAFILSCLLGLGIAMAIVAPLGPTRRARISPLVWWPCMIIGGVMSMYGLSHSTAPSFAAQVTAIGIASAFSDRRVGQGSKFVFGFVPETGSPVTLETHLILPHWSNAEIFAGRTLRITYLNDPSRSVSNEAVDIEVLRGDNAGWHDSRDARPFGLWLAVPIGALIAGFGYIGIRYRKDDLAAVEASEAAT